MNSSGNTLREDSSGSEDNIESQSVQFYLGNAPTTPVHSTSSAMQTPAITPRTTIQPNFELHNHVTNHNHTTSSGHANVNDATKTPTTTVITGTSASSAAAITATPHASNSDRYFDIVFEIF